MRYMFLVYSRESDFAAASAPDKEHIKEPMTVRRMVGVIKEWEEGHQLLCMGKEVYIHTHKYMPTKLAIQALKGKSK